MAKKKKRVTQKDRTPCEVYSRVVGYLRPVNQWNDGKSSEYSDRKEYQV
jgi:ribonucleoside-triphosphate reductase (formate)